MGAQIYSYFSPCSERTCNVFPQNQYYLSSDVFKDQSLSRRLKL